MASESWISDLSLLARAVRSWSSTGLEGGEEGESLARAMMMWRPETQFVVPSPSVSVGGAGP